MHTVPNDLELVYSEFVLEVGCISLLADIGLDPIWLDGLLALMIDVLASNFQTGAHKVMALNGQLRKLGVLSNYMAHDLNLLLLNSID